MGKRLTDREKRTVRIGIVCAVIIMVGFFLPDRMAKWRQTRNDIARMEATLREIQGIENPKQAGLMKMVPVFQMPSSPEKQDCQGMSCIKPGSGWIRSGTGKRISFKNLRGVNKCVVGVYL